jgi:DNA-binding beta-propeller fold protein YncE
LYARQMHPTAARRNRRMPLVSGSLLTLSLLALGCGNQYRPVVSAINPVGPASQPTKYAVAISNPNSSSAGLLTIVDFSGDTVLTTPQILSNPSYLALGGGGAQGFIINSAGSFNEFGTGNPTSLISSNITQSTLSAGATPVSITSAVLSSATTASVFVPEPGLSQIAALSSTGSLIDNIGVSNNPVYVVAAAAAPRAYAISQGDGSTASYVSSIEAGNLAISGTINVGVDPTYGVMTADDKRAFILNTGSGTVNVINVVNNGPDLNSTLGPNSTIAVGLHPVWADLSPTTSELLVLNQGDGVNPGSLSIISIPLCNAAAQPTNPNCDPSNPVDATGFGTVQATVPVGINPVMISALQDGSYAYVVNSGNATDPGSVTVVNIAAGTVAATIPAGPEPTSTAPNASPVTYAYGHPSTVAATTGTPTGKVYITSPDSHYLTVIETDTNAVTTHVNLQGLGVRVVVTAP